MIVGKAIYYLLTNATDVTDVVSTRIYPEVAQQDSDLPFIVYNVTNNEPTDTKPEPSKLDTAQVEVNIYAESYTEAIDLAVAVRAALDRVKGTYNGVNVQSIQYQNEVIDFDEPQRAYNISADYDVRISRSGFEIAQGSPITGVQLGELSDVDVTGVTNGQLIAYNDATGNWEAADDAGGVTRITQLEDTAIVTPDDREVLLYDGGQWVNDTLGKGDVGLANVDNTSDANKPVSTATQTALDAKADTSAVPSELNDLSDVTITGTPTGNQALIYDATASVFKSTDTFTNRFEDEAENNKQSIVPFAERVYTVKADGDGIFIDPESDTPTAGKVIKRKIYQKAGFLESGAVIGDFTLIHTFADDTAYSATESTFEGFRDGDTYGTPPFTLIQTWEEVTAAPAFTGLLNESYGSGAEAAYSTRRLNGNVTECMVIRRASDSTTTTIGFDSEGNIDESAITTFCSGTTCTVYQWVDQSGNGNDATQSDPTKQPTIYTGGALVKENGKVALDLDGTDFFDITSIEITQLAFFNVSNFTYASTVCYFGDISNGDFVAKYSTYYRVRPLVADMTGSVEADKQILVSILSTTSNASAVYNSGEAVATGANASGSMTIVDLFSIGNGSTVPTGKTQEFILYDADKSSDRTDIEENIGDYFTQNTPLLDTYSGAAAAYSLRLLDSTYTGALVEVYNGSSYADIGANVFGELDTVALAAHCGNNDGFVSKWYDQSGNSNDAAQATTADMPKIYDGTTGVVTENGKPALTLSSAQLTGSLTTTDDLHVFAVNNKTASSSRNDFLSDGSGGPYIRYQNDDTTISLMNPQVSASTLQSPNNQQLLEALWNQSASYIAIDTTKGSNVTQNNITLSSITIGDAVNQSFTGFVQEVVFYTTEQSGRLGISSNINTFYNIYS